ncbi:MAG: pilus assembly protein [Caulobacteraceae bacterium]|nr:pilus assembly protein [Caulobacteraceae bacterium]
MRRSARKSGILKHISSFRRASDGSAAVEFAIVAMPFFMLLFATIEIAMVFHVSTLLDDGVRAAARRIRTGQLQTAGGASMTTFKADVCSRMVWLQAHCASHLSLDVRTYPQWASANPPNPVQANGTFSESALTFTPGGPEDIVMVRAYYRWTLFTPFLSQALSRLSGNQAVLYSTAAFRNEPYDQ